MHIEMHLLLRGRPNRPHYGSYPSVRPSVWPVGALNSKTKRHTRCNTVGAYIDVQWARPHTCRHMAWRHRCLFFDIPLRFFARPGPTRCRTEHARTAHTESNASI